MVFDKSWEKREKDAFKFNDLPQNPPWQPPRKSPLLGQSYVGRAYEHNHERVVSGLLVQERVARIIAEGTVSGCPDCIRMLIAAYRELAVLKAAQGGDAQKGG